jgi:arsenite-transporting ATPase
LPEASVRSIEEQLSGACTVEIAAFDEFSKLLGDVARTAPFDHVVFDTAPTGHTLRLLELPRAWSGFIEANAGGASCLGPLSGLAAQRDLYAATLRALTDPVMTRVVLVARPEPSALAEAERTHDELLALGVRNQHFVLNGVFTPSAGSADLVAHALASRQASALARMPVALARLPRSELPLFPFSPVGIARLRALFGESVATTATGGEASPPGERLGGAASFCPWRETRNASEKGARGESTGERLKPFEERNDEATLRSRRILARSRTENLGDPLGLDALIDELGRTAHGVIFTMGKGGVGKTSVARAIAEGLARRGHRVHLTTTDPADHQPLAAVGLRVSRLDPKAETQRYVAEVLETTASTLDAAGRQLVEEELRSPCTEEVAVFRAFARLVSEGEHGLVVVDTAPTGHTLLLLDAAEAYHREVSRSSGQVPESVRKLLPRLRDPGFAKVVIVTLPEATPVHEAQALQTDLQRAGIEPFAWVVNQSLLPLRVSDPTLVARRLGEARYVDEARSSSTRFALVPFETSPQEAVNASSSAPVLSVQSP